MSLPRLLLLLGLSITGLFFTAAVDGAERLASPTYSSPPSRSNAGTDSTGPQLRVNQQGGILHVQGLFANDSTKADTLTYKLATRHSGPAGTSQSTQSGSFETAPGQTDTLSTIQTNIQPGSRVDIRLTICHSGTVLDDTQWRRTF